MNVRSKIVSSSVDPRPGEGVDYDESVSLSVSATIRLDTSPEHAVAVRQEWEETVKRFIKKLA